MRYLLGFLCVCTLGLMPMVGCSETSGEGGSGGSAGEGGAGDAGQGGVGGGIVACVDNVCPCTEAGIRAAIEAGGDDPYTFDCAGPTTVTTADEIVIDNDVILDGEGNLTVDGDDDHRVFSVPAGVTAELRGLSIRHGRAWGDPSEVQGGGGIENYGTLTLTNSTVSGNTAIDAGGIENNGPLTLTNSTVSGNTGGIRCSIAPVTLTNSTVSGNTKYGILGCAPVTLTNSTVSGNGDLGIVVHDLLTLTNSTVSGHASIGILIERAGAGTLTHSLVDDDCDGPITSNGNNIESPGNTCGFDEAKGDQVNVSADDLKLGPLQDNGGPTMTHALEPGSVAIDVIPALDCDVDEDQRGVARPQGPACDVGAFELEVAP